MDHLWAGLCFDLDCLAVAKRGTTGHISGAGPFQQTSHTAVQAPNDVVFPGDGLGEVERWLCGGNAERAVAAGCACNLFIFACCVTQRLPRNAAHIETGATGPLGLDDDRIDAELAGTDRAGVAAWARADDKELASKCVHRPMRQ